MALKDSDNLKRIEAIGPRTAKLKERKILNDADVQRHDRTLRESLDDVSKNWGISDLDQLRVRITGDYELNTVNVDNYEASVEAVERGLAIIDAEVQ